MISEEEWEEFLFWCIVWKDADRILSRVEWIEKLKTIQSSSFQYSETSQDTPTSSQRPA